MSNKQDRIALRNVMDLERKYKFKRKFSDTLGLISDTRKQTDFVEESMNTAISAYETKLTEFEHDLGETDKSIGEMDESLNALNEAVLNLSEELDTKVNDAVSSAINQKMISGRWAPVLDADVVSSYTSQIGWFTKTGPAVVVGFCINALCNLGYGNISPVISGLPYVPEYLSYGVGMCSGAVVSLDNGIPYFVAETNGTITSNVCVYSSNGGEFTLNGTITYITSQ